MQNDESSKETPLIKAVKDNDKKEVDRLLENGADVNESGDYCYTPLMWAVQLNVEGIFGSKDSHELDVANNLFLGCDLDIVAKLSIEGSTDAVIEYLSKSGGEEVDDDSKVIITELLSVVKRKLSIVKLLLEKGACVNSATNVGDTPLMLAAREVNYGNKAGKLLREVMERSYLYIAELLIEKGARVNAQNDSEDTPLMIAAEKDRFNMVVLLIEKGADVNARDKDGATAIIRAFQKGNFNIIVILVFAGSADVNVQDSCGDTVLMMAARDGIVPIVSFLLNNGADVNLSNNKYQTALMVVANHGDMETAKLLVRKGAKVNMKDKDGQTPLLLAVASRWNMHKNFSESLKDRLRKGEDEERLRIVELLIEKRAEINEKNNDGETALDIAETNGYEKIVKFLIEHGAKRGCDL